MVAPLDKKEESDKDPVDVIILLGGGIVCCLILIGFVSSLIGIITAHPIEKSTSLSTPVSSHIDSPAPSSSVTLTSSPCDACIGLHDNNTKQTIVYSTDITLELPQKEYPRANLLLFSNPEGVLHIVREATPMKEGDWAVVLHTDKKGIADAIVEATTEADYHVSFVIE